jgi:MFS family permease
MKWTSSRPRLLRGAFLPFLIGRTVDLAGGALTPVVLTLAILAASGSVADAGAVAAANMLPTLVFMLLGGVVADRFSRRSLLALTNVMSALVQTGMALILLSGHYDLALMVVLGLCAGVISAFNGPALRGIVPELVDAADLQRANATLATSKSAVRVGAPLLAGILVQAVGGGWALAFDAATSLVAAGCFMFVPTRERANPHGSIRQDLAMGWKLFSSTRWIWISSISYAAINALNVAPLQILGSAIITPVLGAVGWGALLSGRTVGMLLGSTTITVRPLRSPLTTGRLFGVLAVLPLLGFFLTTNLWTLLAFSLLGGVGFSILNITYDSVLHANVSQEMMSRVSAYDDLIAYAAIPASQLLVGPLSAHVGNRQLALWCAVGLAVATLAPLASSSVRAVKGSVGRTV